jgi:tetratricopeptide (TPR) repeat protein
MRSAFAVVLLLFVCSTASAQHFHQHAGAGDTAQFRRSPCNKTYTRPALDSELQKVVWSVTGNETARKYFSQGMTEYYGFNFEAAARFFRAALEVDSSMAMAAWGIALASGPNINIQMQGECAVQALERSREAMRLAKTQPGITQLERDLINALSLRYENPVMENVAYSVAMRGVWASPEGKKNANVGALYAESMFNLRPWGLFDNAQRPALDTLTILDVLEDSMKVEKDAVGANHLWIHAAEAGPRPGDALRSANLLTTLVLESGHLRHMPSHIFLLVGKYDKAVASNVEAVTVDVRQYGKACEGSFKDYWANPDCPAVYFGHYLGHNLFFRSVSAAFLGSSREAIDAARKTRAHVQRFVVNEPGLQRYMTGDLMMLVAHQRWDDIMKQEEKDIPEGCYRQEPFTEDTGCRILKSMLHWARGMANSVQNRPLDARASYRLMAAQIAAVAPPSPTGWGNNTAAAVLAIPDELLLARISWDEGFRERAIEHLKLAVTKEDALTYDEPPQWFAPTRESLGGAYLQTGAFKLAKDTFEVAAYRHPNSGRALYGLMRALQGLHDDTRAAEVKIEFDAAWVGHDYEMSEKKL